MTAPTTADSAKGNMEFLLDPMCNFSELQAFCERLAGAAPGFVRLSEFGRSREGRPLLLLTVTDFSSGEAEDKPGILIQSHVHCHEPVGTSTALYMVQKLVENHAQDDTLKRAVFYVIPRINPDQTEKVVTHSGWSHGRWVNRDERPNTYHQEDIDGNGLVLQMRQECPDGDMCLDPANPQHMIPRCADSKPPFYRYLSEGTIHNWDGVTPLSACVFEGKYLDWNRNWNSFWTPEQRGIGAFPFSEREVYCQASFMADHPNLFASIACHNGWKSVIIPPRGCLESDLDPADRKLLKEMGRLASECCGFPLYHSCQWDCRCSGDAFPTFPGGGYLDFAYFTMGLMSVLFELGTVENWGGLSTEAILNEQSNNYDEVAAILNWQKAHPDCRKAWHEWKPFLHPQLGPVEIGGKDIPAISVSDTESLQMLGEKFYHFAVELAKRSPRLELNHPEVQEVSPGVFRLRLELFNDGEIPDHVTNQMLKLPDKPEPYLEMTALQGAECLSLNWHRKPGHFKPWELRREEWFFRKKSGEKTASVTFKLHGGPAGSVSRTVTF